MALSAGITEDEFNAQKETLEPTCVKIFLTQKPSSEDFSLLLHLFRFFMLLALNFFPIEILNLNQFVITNKKPSETL